MRALSRALWVVSLLCAGGVAAQEGAAMLPQAAPAVLQVIARQCKVGEPALKATEAISERAGSGFVWDRPDRAVTALHVVGGCGQVRVLFQGLGERQAVVERSLLSRDLAILRIDNPPAVRPLTISLDAPATDQRVWVYGYGGGRATREDRVLRVTHANVETPRLEHVVDAAIRRELAHRRSPELDTEVLRVEGFLLPGDSGAPVLDAQGRVVAIGSGGLQRGTVGAGWAVRAKYLLETLRNGVAGAPVVTPGLAGFALVDPRLSAEVRCGDLVFRRTRQLTLEQLVSTADDPLGFLQLAASSGRSIDAFADLSFDIWLTTPSGIAVAVPVGEMPRSGAGYCEARFGPEGSMSLRFAGTSISASWSNPAAALWQVEQASLGFFQGWRVDIGAEPMPDPYFTYASARPLPNGVVRRGGWFVPAWPGTRSVYVFQSHLATDQSYVGVAAINRRYVAGTRQPADSIESFAAAVFAAHLSTLPRTAAD